MSIAIIRKNFEEAQQVLEQFMNNDANLKRIVEAGEVMVNALKDGGKIMSCGNGGSMCDAMHFAEELTGRFRENRRAIAAVSISDPSHMSCIGNDYGYDEIFSRYVDALGKKGDVLLAISTSGNSPNVMKAVKVAQKRGITVVGLTGKNGGQLSDTADVDIKAPFSEYSDRAQEIHIKVIHSLIHYIENHLPPEDLCL